MRRGIGFGGAVVVGVLALALARRRWKRGSVDALTRLHEVADQRARVPEETPGGEPPSPVARYLAFALPDGSAPIGRALIRWRGEFRGRPGGAWTPFTATQHVTLDPPGFVWDARIRMLPLLAVRVRDGYVRGEGSTRARVAGVVPVVEQAGTAELAQSALTRWLGEAAWFPAALVPGGPVRWEGIDESRARAVVEDGAVRAEAEFEFGPGGEIVRMRAMRHRDVDGVPVLTPFEARYGAYELWGGMQVPAEAEVAWKLSEGPFAYWRGRVVEIDYAP